MHNKLVKKIAEYCKWEVNMADLEGHNTEEAKWRSHIAKNILYMIQLEEDESSFYFIDGYYKDDKSEFNGFLVSVNGEDVDDHDDVFFFYENKSQLVEAVMLGEKTNEDFVVTNYRVANGVREVMQNV